MKQLINYLYAHLFSLSFLVAFIFFSMDMSGYFGAWGYKLYYPMLFVGALYCLRYKKYIGSLYILYLIICLLSIIVNDVPSYYHAPVRWGIFVLLLSTFSNMFNSRKIALFRLHLFHIFSILSLVLVTVNYLLFVIGKGDLAQMSRFEEQGIYTGSTANNEMGLLGAVAIMFIIVFVGKTYKTLSFFIKILFLICLICSISMMGLASSRMGLVCTLLSVIFVLYRLNSKSLKKIIISAIIFIVGLFLASNYLGENFKYMLSKNGGEIENIDTHSRDDLWNARIREFKDNPLLGCGFASIKYGLTSNTAQDNNGRIESGSGWMSILSQTGLLGATCVLFIIIPNLVFLIRHRSNSYCAAWYSGMCVMFFLQPFTEAYITTIGAVLCCLFWLNYSVIDSFRKGFLKEEDLDLSIYSKYKLFDKRLKHLKK